MKNMKSIFLILFVLMCSENIIKAQTYYYSNNSNSDFNDPAGWGINTDGSGANPSSLNNTCVLVLSHTKTSSGIATIRGLHIKTDGILYCNYSIFLDGTGKFFKIDSAGTYIQQHVGSLGSALFSGTETFEKGSIVEFRQWPSVIPGASWGFLKFNNSSASANCQLSGNTNLIKNDLVINSGSGIISLSAAGNLNISIENNIEIQSGILDIANSVGIGASRELHLSGNLILTNGTLKCTGSSSAVNFYFENDNDSIFIRNGTFNTSNFKIYVQTAKKLFISGTLNIHATCSLELISSTSSCFIKAGSQLINNGLIKTNSGLFAFLSDTSGTAMLGESSGTNIGNLTFNQTIPAGWKRYRFLSSPITDGNFTGLIDDIHITGQGGKTFGFDSTQTNNSSAFYYDETVSLPNANYGWEPINQLNTQMNSGKGFRVLIRGDRSNSNVLYQNLPSHGNVNIDFTGNPNSGNISIANIANYTNSGEATADGWNLLGNPYPCNIDWNKIYDQSDFSNVNPSIYQRDAKSGNYVAWNASSNSGTGSQYVAPFGGFLIQFNNTPSGNFKESHKTNLSSPVYFKTRTQQSIIEVSDNYGSDLLLIGNNENAKKEYNALEDIIKLFAGNIFIASKSKDNIWLCSDLRSSNHNQIDTIDLILGASSKLKLKLLEENNINKLSLFNKLENKVYPLNKGVDLEIVPGALDSSSWKLISEKKLVNGLVETLWEQNAIYPNPFDNQLYIENKQTKIKSIEIFDLKGELKLKTEASKFENLISLQLAELNEGIYVIIMTDEKGMIQVKKINKIQK